LVVSADFFGPPEGGPFQQEPYFFGIVEGEDPHHVSRTVGEWTITKIKGK
jgi:hypothetical protein